MTVQYYQVVANDWVNLESIINDLTSRVIGQVLAPTADVTFNSLTLTDYLTVGGTVTFTDLTASRLTSTNASQELEAVADLTAWIAPVADETTVASDGSGGVIVGIADPLIVGKGGIGVATLTDHGILLGSGTSAVTPLGVAANGQIPIGSAGADPTLAEITGTANQITSTAGAGTITLSTPQDIHTGASPTFAGLTVTNATVMGSNSVVFQPNADSTTFLQVLDADGGTPVLNVDTTGTGVVSIAGGASNTALDVTGNIVASGDVYCDDVFLGTFIKHAGDTDTYLQFLTNRFIFVAGNTRYFDFDAGPAQDVFYGGGNPGAGNDIDWYWNTAGGSYSLSINGNTGNVGIGEQVAETALEITTTTPYITLHNSTHEDDGRESWISAKGEQSGGEETTLGRIVFSHDGAADDEKGKIVLSTNDGSDTNTPTDRVGIDSAGVVRFLNTGGLPFGSAYGNEIAWAQASAAQNTWYEISDSDMATGQLNNVTHDGNGQLTVLTAGMYYAVWSCTSEVSATNKHVQLTFSINGTETNDGLNHYESFGTSKQFPVSGNAILDLAANDTVEIAIRTTDAGTPNLAVDHLNITLVQIGGT